MGYGEHVVIYPWRRSQIPRKVIQRKDGSFRVTKKYRKLHTPKEFASICKKEETERQAREAATLAEVLRQRRKAEPVYTMICSSLEPYDEANLNGHHSQVKRNEKDLKVEVYFNGQLFLTFMPYTTSGGDVNSRSVMHRADGSEYTYDFDMPRSLDNPQAFAYNMWQATRSYEDQYKAKREQLYDERGIRREKVLMGSNVVNPEPTENPPIATRGQEIDDDLLGDR